MEFEGEKPIATVRRDGMRPEEFPIIPSAAGVRGEGKPPESDTLQIQRSGTRYHRRSPSNPLDKRKNEKRLQSYRKGRRRIGPGGFSPKGASHQRNPLSLTDGETEADSTEVFCNEHFYPPQVCGKHPVRGKWIPTI